MVKNMVTPERKRKLYSAFLAVTMCAAVFVPMAAASSSNTLSTHQTSDITAQTQGTHQTKNPSWLQTPLTPSERGVIPSSNPSFDPSDALIKGANYLKHAQADVTEDNAGNGNPDGDPNDGGWDWVLTLPDVTHSSTPSEINLYGVTALGLYYAYLATNDASYLTAMTDAANVTIASPGIRTASDLIFLMLYDGLPEISGTTYQDAARAKYDDRIATYGSAQALAEHIRDLRAVDQGYENGIVAWDIGAWARVAAMLDARYPGHGYGADAGAIAEVIYQDSFMDNPGYFDIIDDQGWDPTYSNVNYWWYTLGITGLIDAFTFSGTHTAELPGLLTILMACQYGGGGGGGAFSYSYGAHTNDEDWQSTAYAVMSLAHDNQALYQSTINQAFTWLVTTQGACGGWVYSDDSHYLEIGGECTSALYFANGPVKNIDTGKVYSSIQAAIDDDATLDGQTIQVAPGIYYEDQVTITKALTIQGAGWVSTIIDGGDAALSSCGLVRIIASGDVTFSGFTVQHAGGPANGGDGGDGLTNVGIYTETFSPTATYTISDNKILGTNNPDDWQDYGLYAYGGLEHLLFQDNIITQVASNSILVEKNPGSTELSGNTLDAGCWGIDSIYYMTYSGTDITSLQKISGNTIDLSTGTNPHGLDDNAVTGIGFSSAYLGCTGTDDTGKYTNIEISYNIITNLRPYVRGIALDNFAWGDGHGGEISNAVICNNIITGISTGSPSFGIRLSGYVTNTMIRENQITGCDMCFYGKTGFYGSSTAFPEGTTVCYNVFMNTGAGFIWEGPSQLDAKYNYWGDAAGPTPTFGGVQVSGNVLYTPFIHTNPPWDTTLSFRKQGTGYTWDTAVFGEKTNARDGQDAFDVPKPGIPPSPYIYAFFDAGLTDPYQRLWKDYRQFLHEQETWDLYVQSNTNTGTTNVVMSWNTASINTSEYDFVKLCDANGVPLANMRLQSTYTLLGLPDDVPLHLTIVCGVNHVPVAAPDTAAVRENISGNQMNVLANDADSDGNTLAIASVTQPTHGSSSTDGSFCYYTPTPGYHGPDSFTYTITDGFGGAATANVAITVVRLHSIPVSTNWNLISVPCNAAVAKTDIIVRYAGTDYTWTQAVANGYIVSTIYGWNATQQQYYLATTLVPGQGYWCWANVNVELHVWSDAVGTGQITTLKPHWNIIGLPYETPVNVQDLLIDYDSQTYTWSQAVSAHIVLGFVYGWGTGIYTLDTTLQPSEGYWMYAYHECTLKRTP